MAVVERLEQSGPDSPEYQFWCPGCRMYHWFKTTGGAPCWTFNGDLKKPTVRASILVRRTWKGEPRVCHLFMTDGQLQFLSDCTHALAGQTVDMEAVDAH